MSLERKITDTWVHTDPLRCLRPARPGRLAHEPQGRRCGARVGTGLRPRGQGTALTSCDVLGGWGGDLRPSVCLDFGNAQIFH